MTSTTQRAASDAADPREYAGYRQHAVSAVTGTLTVLLDGIEGGYDVEGGRWQTICDEHAWIISHTTRDDARSWLRHPEEWCEPCQATVKP